MQVRKRKEGSRGARGEGRGARCRRDAAAPRGGREPDPAVSMGCLLGRESGSVVK